MAYLTVYTMSLGPGGGWPVLKSFVYNQTKELLKCDLF